MENISPQFKSRVMRRVYGIWFVKRVLPRLIAETALVYIVVSQIAEHVFVNRVLQNAVLHTFSRSPVAMLDFFARAFMNSGVLVQALVVGSAVFGILMIRDIFETKKLFQIRTIA